MDSLPEERFDRHARIAKNQCKVSITLITFVDAERQWFKTHLGISETEGLQASSFCNHTITEDRVLYIPDAAEEDRFHDNPMVTGSPHIRFYAGAPVRTADGQRIGTLCLADATPRILDADDLKSIRNIADCIEQELTQTDRGAVYAAHQASRISAMIESVGDAILGLDEKGTIRSANSAVREVFCYAPDELFAQNLSANTSAAQKFQTDPQTGVTDDETIWVDADGDDRNLDGPRKDGSTFHMQLAITEMAHFGQRQFVAVARDVTEQKTQELYLEAIIENIPDMVFVKDAEDLCFTLFNRAAEELIGKSDFDFVPREQAEAFTTKDREVLRQTGVVDIWEEPIDTSTKG